MLIESLLDPTKFSCHCSIVCKRKSRQDAWPEVFKIDPNRDSPSPGKTPLNAILSPYLPLFWRTCLVELKIYPKRPSIESKITLFLIKRHILSPNRDSHRIQSQKSTLFSRFSGHACVQHYFSSDPPGMRLSSDFCISLTAFDWSLFIKTLVVRLLQLA